jgi:hypothetical protein
MQTQFLSENLEELYHLEPWHVQENMKMRPGLKCPTTGYTVAGSYELDNEPLASVNAGEIP